MLSAVSCSSANFCMAVGSNDHSENTLSMTWDGNAWLSCRVRTRPRPTLSMPCRARTPISAWPSAPWLAPATSPCRWPPPGTARPGRWSPHRCPCSRESPVPASDFCMGVGVNNSETHSQTAAATWDGTAWTTISTPNPDSDSDYFNSVSCNSSTSSAAVGAQVGNSSSLVESRMARPGPRARSSTNRPGRQARWSRAWSARGSAWPPRTTAAKRGTAQHGRTSGARAGHCGAAVIARARPGVWPSVARTSPASSWKPTRGTARTGPTSPSRPRTRSASPPPHSPNGSVGVSYNATLSASGGNPPYKWEVVSGSLPKGLKLNKTTGEVSGKPKFAGTSNFTAEVSDTKSPKAAKASRVQNTAEAALSISVGP